MKNVKYEFLRCGPRIFRIKYEMLDDGVTGLVIRYAIQDPVEIPKSALERIKQMFSVNTYHFGYWTPALADDTLAERVNGMMLHVMENEDNHKKVIQTWERIDNNEKP